MVEDTLYMIVIICIIIIIIIITLSHDIDLATELALILSSITSVT